MIEQACLSAQAANAKKLELLRQRINNEDYLRAAIQRLALVLSKELMDLTRESKGYERQRKRRI